MSNSEKLSFEENTISSFDLSTIDAAKQSCSIFAIPPHETIAYYYKKTSRRFFDKTALKWEQQKISFAQFDGMVSSFKAALFSCVGGKKQVIAVIMERSPELYAAIYAIVCTGNAYLPVLPGYPKDRVEYMLRDSRVQYAICDDKVSLPEGIFRITPEVEDDVNQLSITEDNVKPEDVAYILYTSGSTGTPKGVAISNYSVVNRIRWMHQQYGLKAGDTILQKTPVSFDVSVWELFWWGMFGGSLGILPPDAHYHPNKIVSAIGHFQVTHIHFVPSMFNLFLDHIQTHPDKVFEICTLRHIFLSGEALHARSVNGFYNINATNSVQIHNLYGPTECTVDVTAYTCSLHETDPVPIGRPISETCIYILDKYGKPVPPMVTGELYISGINVGLGYINHPEMTKERFLPNPFGPGRLYRTGDLAKWRLDGQILFCGRADHQIKLNGQRIELEEIEQALLSVSGIHSAAVILKKENDGGRLAAFYSGTQQEPMVLRDKLSKTLPGYMIPSTFSFMNSIPLTASGKTNRSALQNISIPEVQTSYGDPPESTTEKMLCDVFSKVLKVDSVGRNTDFFAAGGTSLDLIQAFSTEPLLKSLTVADFLAHPTPSALAARMEKRATHEFTFVKTICSPQNPICTLVLFPFAGGNAASFAGLVQVLSRSAPDLRICCIEWYFREQAEAVASEIMSLYKEGPVLFYSHCAGAALALEQAQLLKEKHPSGVLEMYIGASAPSMLERTVFSRCNPWNLIPETVQFWFLRRTGLDISGISKTDIRKFNQEFRTHTSRSFKTLSERQKVLPMDCTVITGSADPFTGTNHAVKQRWRSYFSGEVSVISLPGEGHYFHQRNPERLSRILMDALTLIRRC